MLTRAAVILTALLAISACSNDGSDTQPAANTPATQSASTASSASATAATPEATASAASAASADSTPAAAAVAAATPAAPAPPEGMPEGPAPVLGTDYFLIDTPAVETGNTISVIEVFNYRCPVCAHLQPTLDAWLPTLPSDVKFSLVPAAFGGPWDDFVLAFYAADAMGVRARTHSEIFKSFHEENSYSHDDIAAAYAKYGVDKQVFAATMDSFAVKAKLARARAQITTWGVDSIPAVIVGGKYRVKKTVVDDAFLHNVEWVVAKVRAERKGH